MPELPEVETVARTLAPMLTGKRVDAFDLHWPRTLASPSLAIAQTHVLDHYVTSVGRRAKLVTICLDSGNTLTVHLRMTGELLFRANAGEPRSSEREPYLRARFGLSDDAELLFYDTRKFGRINVLTPDEYLALDRALGIEPLDAAFSVAALSDVLSRRNRQIKPLLLDQQVIAGLGNIYVDEALFRAGIHPLTASNQVDADRVQKLHSAIVTILSGAIERRGTTFRNYRSGLGEQGDNQRTLMVYGQKDGSPCPRCGTPLERTTVGQRGTVHCPHCQPR